MSSTLASDAPAGAPLSSATTATPAAPKKRLRLEYLDGLRGLAALFVVLHHAHAELTYRYQGMHDPRLESLLHKTRFLAWGHFSVDLFIVLSGYVLMLPVVRSAAGQLKGGFKDYIRRRALRILPPYYVALGLSLALIALWPGLRYATSPDWNHPLVAFTPGILISHFLMAHNFAQSWIYRIDLPMWSVATEWQIYFIFPALLLPLWRKVGIAAAVVVGLLVGYLPHFLLPMLVSYLPNGIVPKQYNLDDACFWYTGLFAMGMAGSYIGFSEKPSVAKLRENAPWALISAAVFGALLVYGLAGFMAKNARWMTDPFVGLATATLLIYCTRQISRGEEKATRPSLLVRIFQHKWTETLGIFSYSLYLIHYPILGALNTLAQDHHVKPATHFYLSFGVFVPVIVVCAYLFHLAFERRFMPQFQKAKEVPAPKPGAPVPGEVVFRPAQPE